MCGTLSPAYEKTYFRTGYCYIVLFLPGIGKHRYLEPDRGPPVFSRYMPADHRLPVAAQKDHYRSQPVAMVCPMGFFVILFISFYWL